MGLELNEDKPNGKSKSEPKIEVQPTMLQQLEAVIKVTVDALTSQNKHVEKLVGAIEAPARVAGEIVAQYKVLCEQLRARVSELEEQLNTQRKLMQEAQEETWARERLDMEFAQRVQLRDSLLDLVKEHAPTIVQRHAESSLVRGIVSRLNDQQMQALQTVVTPEEWAALQKFRRVAPETNEGKENGNS